MRADAIIHDRLGELGLVAFVVAEAAIAPHVDHDIAVEGLAVFDRELAREGHGLGIVAVDVQDRRHHPLGDVAGVGRRPRKLGRGGEADLVVDDEVDAAAGVIAGDAREREALPHHALTRKGGIAVDQDGKHLILLLQIIADRLLRAGLAEHHRVHRFEVRGVGHKAHVHRNPVELAVGRGAEVILHVAAAADIIGVGRAAREFVEDHAVGLGHHVGEHVQPPAVGHAVDDLAHARAAAVLDHRFQRRDHRFAAVEAEALGADIFLGEEFLVAFAAQHCGKDRLLAFGGELDGFARLFELFLQETAFLGVGDVHVFEADLAAIDFAQALVECGNRGPFHAEHAADIDFLVLLARKPVPFEREVSRAFAVRQAERIEVRRHVPAHTVEPHQRHRRDAELGGLFDGCRIGRLARVLRRLGDRERHLGRVHRGHEVGRAVGQRVEPAALGPGRAGLRAFLIGEGGEEILRFVAHGGDSRGGGRMAPRPWRARGRYSVTQAFSFSIAASVSPSRLGEGLTRMPASSIAAILSSAPP